MPSRSKWEEDAEDGEVAPKSKQPPPPSRPYLPGDPDSDEDGLGHKRKHKKKDKEKDKEERASKRHKEHKSKDHKKEKKNKREKDESDEEKADSPAAKPREEPREERRERKPSPSPDRSPVQRREGRSRSPRRRSRSPDRRRRSPPRRGRSPPRRGSYGDRGGYDRGHDRRDSYRDRRDDRDRGRDDRGRGRRDDPHPKITEERRRDEERKEKEREEAEAIRKKKEEDEYAKSVAEQFAQMEDQLGSDGELEFEDEEEKAERERRERKERMEKIKADAEKRTNQLKAEAEKRAEERAAEIKKEEAERRANGEVESEDENEEERKHDDQVLAAITPRAKGGAPGELSDEEDEGSEEDVGAGDVDELKQREMDSGHSPRKPPKNEVEARRQAEAEANNVFNMFDDNDQVAIAAKVKAIERGGGDGGKMLADNFDDKEGYLTFQMGEIFHERYEVSEVLGKGVFSTVLGAKDLRYDPEKTKDKKAVRVAIKIIRNNDMMAKCGAKELEFLKLLAKDDGATKHHIVQLSDDFVHHGHMCLVFEPMAMNLRQVIKKFGHNRGINIEGVQVFAKQMFQGLKHLRKCKIVHADIKPDNILINERHNAIKICDFGSGSYINECDITPYLVSRWYRAPEITLCLKYEYSIDLWSICCCLYELYTGKVMFPGNSNNDMLRRFMEIKGRFPNKLIKRSMTKMIELGRPVDFTEDFKFMRIMIDKITKKETVKILTIDEKPVKDMMKLLMPRSLQPDQARKVKQLCDLLHGGLSLNPDNRLSIEQCLHHPFIKEPFGFVPKRREPQEVKPAT